MPTPIETVWTKLRMPAASGDLLERVTSAVLRDHGFVEVQRQLSGSQFGFDIYAQLPTERGREVWKVECKNLARSISVGDLAPKLVWHLDSNLIDHFLVVATSSMTNDLRLLLEKNPFPFPITVWTEEAFAELVLASPSARQILELDALADVEGAKYVPMVFLPRGAVRFDVVHQHDPPREFAYFRTAGGVQKAFTRNEFKLNFIFASRATESVVVTDIACVTRVYRAATDERVFVLVKPKGLFEPETVRFAPSIAAGSEVHLLGGAFLCVPAHQVEVLCAELLAETRTGIYELEFRATLATGERLMAPRLWLVVLDESANTCHLTVFGRHYDSVASRILDLPAAAWSTLCDAPADTMRILGPSSTEIVHGVPAPMYWEVREARGRRESDSEALFFDDHHLVNVLTLDGSIDEELYGLLDAKARAEGLEAVSHVRVDQQLRRRLMLIED